MNTREVAERAESQAVKSEEEQTKASPLPNRFHQRWSPEGVPGEDATAGTAHTSKKVKWLQSVLKLLPDGPQWSQRGGKCLPNALLREV